MKLPIRKILSVVFVLICLNVNAQKQWTLEECIRYALDNNISVKQGELLLKMDKVDHRASQFSRLPNLNGNATHNYNFGRTVDPFTNQFVDQQIQSNSFFLGSSVPLFNGFLIHNQIKQGKYNFLTREQDLMVTKNNIALSVANLYLQILFNRELVASSQRQLESSRLQVERTQRLFEAGRLTQGNVLEIKAQFANEELNLINAENQLRNALLDLAQLIDQKPDSFQIVSALDVKVPEDIKYHPELIFQNVVDERPEVKAASLRLKSSEAGLGMARAGRYPRLSFSANLNTVYTESRKDFTGFRTDTVYTGLFTQNLDPIFTVTTTPTESNITPFRRQIDDNFGRSVGFTLSIPLFNGWQVGSNVSKAKMNVQYNRLAVQAAKNQVYKNVYTASNDVVAAKSKFDLSRRNSEAQNENFKNIEKRYEVGLINTQEYLNAKNNLLQSESNALQAKYELIFKSKILDFYQGKPLSLN